MSVAVFLLFNALLSASVSYFVTKQTMQNEKRNLEQNIDELLDFVAKEDKRKADLRLIQ